MVTNPKFLFIALTVSIVSSEVNRERYPKKKHHENMENSLWKKEYETELGDAMLSSKKTKNFTRVIQSPSSDNEAVIERLMETITASEKYLKKVESIDFRLNRLDIEVHEKTNSILKRLTDITTAIQNQAYSDKLDAAFEILKSDVGDLKVMVEKAQRGSGNQVINGDNAECHLDTILDNRISFLESNTKSIMGSVDAIAAVISEVKNRQYSRNKPEIAGGVDTVALINEFRRAIHEQKSKKCDCRTFGRVDRSERYPTDCQEIQAQGFNVTGIYKIKPDDIEPFYVLCDLSSMGGGWTVIQNRFDGSQDFFKSWSEYKHGFGNLAGEFWLGLEKMYYLTNQKLYELRVEMETQIGQEASATFSVFTVGPEYEGYRISTLGTYRGTAGDSLSYHAGQKFSTYDMDNDEWKEGSCANEHGGAWWYKECDKSNLNGKYLSTAEEANGQSIYWISFKGPNSPLSKTRMMIRPLPATRPLDYDGSRKLLEVSKQSPEKLKGRGKDAKGAVDRPRAPYRYDNLHNPDGFFPYA